jgi:hypothetical protein
VAGLLGDTVIGPPVRCLSILAITAILAILAMPGHKLFKSGISWWPGWLRDTLLNRLEIQHSRSCNQRIWLSLPLTG